MKKMNKIISFTITVVFLLAMSACVFAGGLLPSVTVTPPNDEIGGMVEKLLGLAEVAGFGTAVGMLIYVGIKYTMASANEKADLKTSSIKYLIGAIILFSVTAIFDVVQKLIEQITASA